VCLIDVTSATGDGDAVMARNSDAYPPWLFGYFHEPSMTWRFYASTNGYESLWDYANGVIMGKVAASSWQWLEWGHKNGWNYLSVDGKVQPPFYSASVLPAGSGDVSVGLTRCRWTTRYMYFGQDELYINSAKCLHTADFDPPNAEISIYKDEDYWGNLAQDKTGTDITDDVIITPTYGTEAVSAVLTNNASDGYISYQQRGIGVYFDGTQDAKVEYTAGVNADGYKSVTINQKYQHDTADGLAKIAAILANRQTKRTDLMSVGFYGHRSHYLMACALYVDVGDLVRIQNARTGIDGYYYIQQRELTIKISGLVDCRWTVVQDFEHGD